MAYYPTEVNTVTVKNLRDADVWCDAVTFVRFDVDEYYWVVCVSNDAVMRYYLDFDSTKKDASFLKYADRPMVDDVVFNADMHYKAYKILRHGYEPHEIVSVSPDKFINEYVELERRRYGMMEPSVRFIRTVPLPEIEYKTDYGVQVAEDWSDRECFKAQWEKFMDGWRKSDEERMRDFTRLLKNRG